MARLSLRHLISDLCAFPDTYRLSTPAGDLNLYRPPELQHPVDVFTLTGPAGSETFVINGPRAYGRGGSFDLNSPADRYLLARTVQPSTPSQDEHLGLHAELNDAGYTLGQGQPFQHEQETLTPLTARHPKGRVLWFSEVYRQSFGLPLEHYVQHSGLRLAALRHHETRDTVRRMAQSDDDLKAQGIAPGSLPALLLVSAWPVRQDALDAIFEGEVPAPSSLPPADFEWHPTAYQQLHLSLTRSELQEQATVFPPTSQS